MRFRHALASCAVSFITSIALAPPVVAQSFFQKLFGLGGGQSAPQMPYRPQTHTIPSHRFESRPRQYYQSHPEDSEDEFGPPDSGGPYRTMCVRSCDGYFFPLRHNAKRRNFASDAKSCRSACGTEARLFYYSLNGGSTETMVDLSGRKYSDLPHAFGYRKALVQGCACKPVPWSYEEAARHRQYEQAESAIAAEKGDDEAPAQHSSEQSAIEGGVTSNSGNDLASVNNPGAAVTEQEQNQSAAEVRRHVETYEPIRIRPAKAVQRRRKLKYARTFSRRVAFQPSSQPAPGLFLFGPSKSKY
jgi:hypothetical protein